MLMARGLGYLKDLACLLLNSEQSTRDYKSGAINSCSFTDICENTK